MSDSVRPHRRQPTRLPHPWDSPGKNTGVGCRFLRQCMKVKSQSEVAQSCSTLRNPMDCSTPGSFVPLHYLPEFDQVHAIELVMLPNHLILCLPLLLLPSIFPSIRDFSSKSTLHIRWPKYWSFSFSINPSNEYSGLISLGLTGLISLLSSSVQSLSHVRLFATP